MPGQFAFTAIERLLAVKGTYEAMRQAMVWLAIEVETQYGGPSKRQRGAGHLARGSLKLQDQLIHWEYEHHSRDAAMHAVHVRLLECGLLGITVKMEDQAPEQAKSLGARVRVARAVKAAFQEWPGSGRASPSRCGISPLTQH